MYNIYKMADLDLWDLTNKARTEDYPYPCGILKFWIIVVKRGVKGVELLHEAISVS